MSRHRNWWAKETINAVLGLAAAGMTDAEVARLTGVPAATVRNYRRGRVPRRVTEPPWRECLGAGVVRAAYAYLLGVYLGDGHVADAPRTARFSVSLDAAYPGIVAEVSAAAALVCPSRRVRTIRPSGAGHVVVSSYGVVWREVFPQAGAGPKHERPIVLAAWQREIVDEFPEPFLRGLIHSDGCRTENRFTTRLPSGRLQEYAYPRYFFSNLSADIRRLFCDACDALGIRWTQSNPRNISVAHRRAVARLDEFVGPKH